MHKYKKHIIQCGLLLHLLLDLYIVAQVGKTFILLFLRYHKYTKLNTIDISSQHYCLFFGI